MHLCLLSCDKRWRKTQSTTNTRREFRSDLEQPAEHDQHLSVSAPYLPALPFIYHSKSRIEGFPFQCGFQTRHYYLLTMLFAILSIS